MHRLLALSVVLLPALTGAASAAEGRIPLLSLPGPPYTINQPGHYIVTRNIGFSTGSVVVIQTTGVTLDLGGHTVTGPGSAEAGSAIEIVAPPAPQGITILNGRIHGGSHGVRSIIDPLTLRFENLDISWSQTGIAAVGKSVEIIGCHVHDLTAIGSPATAAVSVNAPVGRILDNLIESVTGSGLVVTGFAAGEIRHNVVRNFGSLVAGGSGIFFSLPPSEAGGAIIADNMVSGLPNGADDFGMSIMAGTNLVTGNVAIMNGAAGFQVAAPYSRLERNVASNNISDGILFLGGPLRVHLEENQVQANGGCGLNIGGATGLFYRNNNFSNNLGGIVCFGTAVNGGGNYCGLAPCP